MIPSANITMSEAFSKVTISNRLPDVPCYVVQQSGVRNIRHRQSSVPALDRSYTPWTEEIYELHQFYTLDKKVWIGVIKALTEEGARFSAFQCNTAKIETTTTISVKE